MTLTTKDIVRRLMAFALSMLALCVVPSANAHETGGAGDSRNYIACGSESHSADYTQIGVNSTTSDSRNYTALGSESSYSHPICGDGSPMAIGFGSSCADYDDNQDGNGRNAIAQDGATSTPVPSWICEDGSIAIGCSGH